MYLFFKWSVEATFSLEGVYRSYLVLPDTNVYVKDRPLGLVS